MGEREHRGTISKVSTTRWVIVNTGIHGEIELQFRARGSSTKILIKAWSFLTEAQLVDWENSISGLGQRLGVV